MAACVRIRVLGLVALVGCGDRYGRILELEGDRLQGEILYSQDCASCHGDDGYGGIGPSLVERLPLLTDEEILETIETGPGAMTPFEGRFTNQELADLVLFLKAEFQ